MVVLAAVVVCLSRHADARRHTHSFMLKRAHRRHADEAEEASSDDPDLLDLGEEEPSDGETVDSEESSSDEDDCPNSDDDDFIASEDSDSEGEDETSVTKKRKL